jgi:hypothetical protein
MQKRIPSGSSSPLSRVIPTRRAALALLALDAVLLIVPLFVRWQNWFAFAYVPLLITVALGALMSGRGRLGVVLTGIAIPILMGSLWAVFKFASPSLDLLDTAVRAGAIASACLGVVWFCIALWGWVRFFAGRPCTTAKV